MFQSMPEEWEMYEAEGNLAVAEMMAPVRESLKTKSLPEVRQFLKQEIKKVSETYGEVFDSEVRNTIAYRMTRWACQVHELPSCSALYPDYWQL